jgi:hypothetical protein
MAVYQDIVSGKKFAAHDAPIASKRRYIKGFQPSRGKITATIYCSNYPRNSRKMDALHRFSNSDTP